MTQQIGIAIVLHRGKVIVGKRADDVLLPGMSEFPGGKCLVDESAEQCAVRECLEETGVNVTTTRLSQRIEHQYPDRKLHLHFWECEVCSTTMEINLPAPWRWVPLEQLSGLEFPPANREIISQLIATHESM